MEKNEVLKIATLSRLELSEEQCERFGREMTAIVGWFAKLQEVSTDGVPPMASVVPESRPHRQDVVSDGGLSDILAACAPKSLYGYYAVPKMVE
ncbi:MAG: Asp-tRNA(Asn)/Glu-tRNA(Gln) amidotransferase subunit GatC [Rickettsiales bacterium]